MESLASRVRPLTLATEPIHHANVTYSIELILSSAESSPSPEDLEAVAALRDAWHRYGLDEDSEIGYVMSISTVDGSEATVEANDVQLAAGWFYADVAHANPTGWKQQALLFPRAQRFEAAVLRWSMLAVTTLQTLDLVRQLQNERSLGIPEEAFEPDLATDRGTPERTIVMVAPFGTPMPSLTARPDGPEWQLLNVGTAARLTASSRVDVALARDGRELLRRPGAVTSRLQEGEDTVSLAVLVDEAVVFQLRAPRDGRGPCQMRQEIVWQTNAAVRDGTRLLNTLRESDQITFTGGGIGEFHFAITPAAQEVGGLEITRYADDVAAIELILGRTLPCIDQVPGANRRVAVHLARLAMEGNIVAGVAGPIDVSVDQDDRPHGIAVTISPLEVGDAQVALPTLMAWHPDAAATPIGPRRWRVSVPSGEPFLVWAPSAQDVQSDTDLVATARLDSWDSPDSADSAPLSDQPTE